MPRKTIYLSDDDEAYIEAHRASVGPSLSAALMRGLRMVVARDEAKELGFEEVQVSLGTAGARQLKTFDGRVMARSRMPEDGDRLVVSRRIYLTPRGSWVYVERADVNWDRWTSSGADGSEQDSDGWDGDPGPVGARRIFEVRESLEELAEFAPAELLAAARAAESARTAPVERLDI